MSENHLEEMIAEWYEYQGYFVKRNVQVGKRAQGGFECELDIVAYNPERNHLVHIEPSLDADSWETREKRYTKKFEAGRRYIKGLFPRLHLPDEIEQIAVFVFASSKNHPTVGGGRVMIADELIVKIFRSLDRTCLEASAIPEQWPILRTFQYVYQYRTELLEIWKSEYIHS